MSQYYFASEPLSPLELPAANQQAESLNECLQAQAAPVYELLSACGKSLYYPRAGLLLQAQEAEGCRYNATVGIALDDAGRPLHYSSIAAQLNVDAGRCVSYASSYGLLALRQQWQRRLLQKNPSLKVEHISLPLVTGGITHGLWIALQMFLGRGEELLLPHLFWPNYRLIAEANCALRLRHYNTFCGAGLDLAALRQELRSSGEKKVLLFNFPHNPTGYSPSVTEVHELQSLLLAAAESGKRILVICDDAYWGLYYEEYTARQSLFTFICGLHRNILAVKLDGASKEDFAWGLRVGFITFGYTVAAACEVLQQKAGAAVRLSISNSSHLSQELLLAAYLAPETESEHQRLLRVLAARYAALCSCLHTPQALGEWRRYLKPLPFNSGYFMTFEIQPQNLDAEVLRQHLLTRCDIGLIALQDRYLRFAFSAVAASDIAHIVQTMHDVCRQLAAPDEARL